MCPFYLNKNNNNSEQNMHRFNQNTPLYLVDYSMIHAHLQYFILETITLCFPICLPYLDETFFCARFRKNVCCGLDLFAILILYQNTTTLRSYNHIYGQGLTYPQSRIEKYNSAFSKTIQPIADKVHTIIRSNKLAEGYQG